MYLSSFELNLDHKDARRDLANPYEMHRTLARLVDGGQALWRLEGNRVLFVSEAEPVWSEIDDGYFAEAPSLKPYPVEKMKLTGRRLRFRLLANPSKSIKEGLQKESRGKRVQLIKDSDLLDWLAKQGARNGFELDRVEPRAVRELRFRKKRGQAPVVLGTCTFDGVLTVHDEALFKNALRQGLGRGKAFGLGLLTVAPGN